MRRMPSIRIALIWLIVATPVAAQAENQGSERGPRFLLASSTTAAPVRVDARTLPTLGQRLAVHFVNETVTQALESIAAQTGLRFIFSRDVVTLDRTVTIDAADISLAAVLTELLLDADVDVVFSPAGHAALVPRRKPSVGEVAGRVVDAVTGAAVVNAGVEIIGRDVAATTNAEGTFRLPSVPPDVVQLRITALGFVPFVQSDVVVSTGKPVWVLVELRPEPVRLGGIAVGPSWFAAPREVPTSTQRLNVEEIRRSPGAQEDVVRAISLLPGVAPTAIHRNDLIVRGGAPFENLFIVDGLEVPNINHFAAQGSSGGQASLLNLDFLRSVQFSAGGFGATQGDRVGSVTTLSLREGITDRHAGEVNFAATGFGVMAEGPVGAGSYLVGLRRSYFDLILKASGEPFFLRYWDVNAKVSQRLGQRDELSWTFVGALDDWGFNIETPEDRYDAALMAVNDDQYFSGLTWSHTAQHSRLQLTLGRVAHSFHTFQNDTLGQPLFTNRSTEAENSLRLNFNRVLASGTELELGATAKHADRLRYDIEIPGSLRTDLEGTARPLDLDSSFTAFRMGWWGEARTQWTTRFSTRLGARADYYAYLDDAVRVAPRLAATLELNGGAALSMSAGRYWQTPSFIWLAGDPSNADNLRPFRVDQIVIGFQKLLREDLKLQLEAYRKRYRAYPTRPWRPQAVLTPGIESVEVDVPFGLEPLTSQGTGSAAGVELFLQKRSSSVPVYGLASISINSTEFSALDGVSRISAYDLPIAANLAVGWRPNALWDLGLRFRAASGLPRTAYINSGPQQGRLDFARYNDDGRMPAFHALDIRVDRRWSFRRVQLTTYLDIQDLYNRDNPIAYVWDQRDRAPRYERAIGFLPSLGVNIEF
jgi:hypothetical protein